MAVGQIRRRVKVTQVIDVLGKKSGSLCMNGVGLGRNREREVPFIVIVEAPNKTRRTGFPARLEHYL